MPRIPLNIRVVEQRRMSINVHLYLHHAYLKSNQRYYLFSKYIPTNNLPSFYASLFNSEKFRHKSYIVIPPSFRLNSQFVRIHN